VKDRRYEISDSSRRALSGVGKKVYRRENSFEKVTLVGPKLIRTRVHIREALRTIKKRIGKIAS